MKKSILLLIFTVLLGINAQAQFLCPTSTTHSAGLYIFNLSNSEQCSYYPAIGANMTLNGAGGISGTYGIQDCTDNGDPVGGPFTIELSFGSGIPVPLTAAPVSFTINGNTCTYNSEGKLCASLPTMTISAISPICAGATSFTIPYSATTGTPTTYSISGEGIESVTDGDLPNGSITVKLSTAASGTSISFILTVKNADGCSSDNIKGSVKVNTPPRVSIKGPSTICIGSTTSLSPSEGGTWTSSNPDVATVTTNKLGNSVRGQSAGQAQFTFTQTSTGCTAQTDFVTVNPTPTVKATNETQNICSGDAIQTIALSSADDGLRDNRGNISLSLRGGGGTTVYEWTRDNTTEVTGIAESGSGDISGSLTNKTDAPVTVTFTITPYFTSNEVSCDGKPITATVVVNPAPSATISYVGSPFLNTVTSGLVTRTGTAGGTYSATPNGLSINSTTGEINPSTSTLGDYIVKYTIAASGACAAKDFTTNVTVKTCPSISGGITCRSTICVGETSCLTLFGPSASLVGTWASNDPDVATVNGSTVTGKSGGSATFTFTETSTGCKSEPMGSVTVNPTPTVAATNKEQNICSGDDIRPIVCSSSSDLVGSGRNTLSLRTGGSIVYNWTRDETDKVTGMGNKGTANSSNDFTISGSLINITDAPVTVTFTITPRFSDGFNAPCDGTPITATVVVKPTPSVSITGARTICIGSTTTLSPTTGGTWTSSNPDVATVTDAGVVTGQKAGTARFTFTQTVTGCKSAPSDLVTVNLTPTVVATNKEQNICSGDDITPMVCFPFFKDLRDGSSTLSVRSSDGVRDYTWTRDKTTEVIGMEASGIANSANSNTISGSLINTTNAPITVTFTITPRFTQNGVSCNGTSITATVTVNISPKPIATSPQNFCILPTPTVANLEATGSNTNAIINANIKWYAAETGGDPLPPTTALVNGTTYYASQTNETGCESSARAAVVVELNTSCFKGEQGLSGAKDLPPGFKAVDPCSCNNNSDPNTQNNGTFNEFIQVSGPSGATITGTAVGGTPAMLTFTEVVGVGGQSTYTSNIFTHVDNIGYSADLFAQVGAGAPVFIKTESNRCIYPNVTIDPKGPFINCSNHADVPLTATITPSMTGTLTWSGTGVTGSNFNPSGLPTGNATTNLSFKANFVNNVWDGTTAANPGCIQTASRDIVIEADTEKPKFTACPSDITVGNDAGQCDAVVNFTVTATDNCTTPQQIIQTAGLKSGEKFPLGTVINVFSAKDEAGNETLCSFKVTVNDTEKPKFTACPSDITVGNDAGQCDAVVNFTVTATDNCTTPQQIIQTAGLKSGEKFPLGTVTNTFTATDGAGNAATPCSFKVTVNDTEKPKFTACPTSDITVGNDAGQCDAVVNFTVTATDNCTTPQQIVQTAGLKSGEKFPVGTTTNTFTATDGAGNTATPCSFKVTVNDTEKPKFTTCPTSDITVSNDAGRCDAVVNFPTVRATDNCNVPQQVIQTAGLKSGSMFPVGTTTNTFTATDGAGNTATPCSFKVTVNDTEKPKITCPPNQTFTLGSFECSRQVSFGDPSVSDNCGATFQRTDVYKSALKSGSPFSTGNYLLSYRATDAAGNFADCSFSVQVNGQVTTGRLTCVPTLTVSLDDRQCINVLDPTGLLMGNTYYCASTYSVNIPGKTDNYIRSSDIGKTFTVSVNDNFNNSCSTVVTVMDTKAPVWNTAQDVSITCDEVSRNGNILTNAYQPNIIYECSRTTVITQDRVINPPAGQTNFSAIPQGFPADKIFNALLAFNANRIIVRTYTATDESNNTSSIQQIFYVRGIYISQVQCPKDVTVACVQGDFNTSIQTTGIPSVNNGRSLQDISCNIDYSYTDVRENNAQGYVIKRTWTLVDRITQARQTCVQNITVNDTKPTLSCPPSKTVAIGADKKVVVMANSVATATDNCTPQNALVWAITEGGATAASLTYTCADLGNKNIQVTVKDAAGNTSNCSMTLQITDPDRHCVNIPLLALSGDINRETGEKVAATVKLANAANVLAEMQGSTFLFDNLQQGQSYRVRPERDHDILNGVTTLDIALLSELILNIRPFSSPYQAIAADVNRDGEIDATDMLLIRNLILRRTQRFPNNTAWRFIPKSFTFSNPQNPFADDFPEVLNINNLNNNINKADFVAIKVGDINLTARNNALALTNRNNKPVENIYLEDQKMEAGKEYIFDITIKNTALKALQLALKIDKNKTSAVSVESGNLPQFVDAENLEINEQNGNIAAVWVNTSKASLTEENSILQIKIKPRQSAWLHELVSLDEQNMENLAYDTEGGVEKQLKLTFGTSKLDKPQFELHQNRPNPFSQQSTISFILPESNVATISIYDVTGKQIFNLNQKCQKGYNEITVNNDVFKNTGLYFYRLQSNNFSAVKRLQFVAE